MRILYEPKPTLHNLDVVKRVLGAYWLNRMRVGLLALRRLLRGQATRNRSEALFVVVLQSNGVVFFTLALTLAC